MDFRYVGDLTVCVCVVKLYGFCICIYCARRRHPYIDVTVSNGVNLCHPVLILIPTVLTAVILTHSSETSGPLSNGRALISSVYRIIDDHFTIYGKIFWRPKGGFEQSPSNLPYIVPVKCAALLTQASPNNDMFYIPVHAVAH